MQRAIDIRKVALIVPMRLGAGRTNTQVAIMHAYGIIIAWNCGGIAKDRANVAMSKFKSSMGAFWGAICHWATKTSNATMPMAMRLLATVL